MATPSRLMQFVNSPTGPKTTHFWGPVANWGFVLAVRRRLEHSYPPSTQPLDMLVATSRPKAVSIDVL